jgi:hypothetical protein
MANIMAAITNATVANMMMRLIDATSYYREGRTRGSPAQLINEVECDRLEGLAQLPRILILGTSMNKYHQARLRLLVGEEHPLAKAVRCGLDPALGVLMLRSVLCVLLIGGDKLAGREHFTSAGCEDDAHSGSFFDNPPPGT